mgnify:CR=1 FL=1
MNPPEVHPGLARAGILTSERRHTMSNKLSMFFIAFFFCVLPMSALWAVGPEAPRNYSADIETTTPRGTFVSKISLKDGKQRVERSGRGRDMITIIRPDKNVIWMLMSDKKLYMEMPFDRQKQDIASQLSDPRMKTIKEFIGNDTADGHPAKKYHVTIDRGGTREKSGYLWEAIDLDNFPVMYQSEDKTITTVWKNITRGGVSDAQFEIPAGFTKMDVPASDVVSPGIRNR